MKLSINDLEQLTTHIGTLRDQAFDHLDHIFNYLDGQKATNEADVDPGSGRINFSDTKEHVTHASRVGKVLDLFAEIQMWAEWKGIVERLLISTNGEATMTDCANVLSRVVIGRTSRLSASSGKGPLADAYSLLLTEHFADAVQTCHRTEAVMDKMQEIITKVAGDFGVTYEVFEAGLKANNREYAQAVAREAILQAQTKIAEAGMPVPEVPENLLQVLGIDPASIREVRPGEFEATVQQPEGGIHVGDVSQADADAGLDGERCVPRYALGEEEESGGAAIKVG